MPEARYYLVTIRVRQGATPPVREIRGEMRHTPVGEMVQAVWRAMTAPGRGLTMDALRLLPDRIEGAVGIGGHAIPLADVVYRFKAATNARHRLGEMETVLHPFPGSLWEHGFYERALDLEELEEFRREAG